MVYCVISGNWRDGNPVFIIRLDAEGFRGCRGRTGTVFSSDTAAIAAGNTESDDCPEKEAGYISGQRRDVVADCGCTLRRIYSGGEMKRLLQEIDRRHSLLFQRGNAIICKMLFC